MRARHVVAAALTALPALCATTTKTALVTIITTTTLTGHAGLVTEPAVLEEPGGMHVGLRARSASTVSVATDDSSLTQHDSSTSDPKFSDFRDPFYASTFPICYALAATTVTSYMLVIMLFITPRSFLDGGVVYLGRRNGFTHSSTSSVTIGGRPWLQKIAALTVAISLTVATADTFRVAQNQYTWGIQNAKELQDEVMGSTELKVIRIVSDTFLWLAQAQTLIRLFPRQREKVIIKWVAFALIVLDIVFSTLNSFEYSENGVNASARPKSFVHPVPALSYLFQLSLGLLYAAWVIYYALMKKRYAFYHPLMKNICVVAIISITSVAIPVVFFILDISQPDFTGWGDYVRWVGAAAASVVVWEWVERIEALEREEKKDGILGREVFDGDDMLEVNAADFGWLRNRKNRKDGGPGSGSPRNGQQGASTGNGWPNVTAAITNRYRGQSHEVRPGPNNDGSQRAMGDMSRPAWPAPPQPAVTPISRTDTASAASTVYAVRYQPPSEATTRTPDPLPQQSMVDLERQNSAPQSRNTSDDSPPLSQAQNGGHVMFSTDRPSSEAASQEPGWRNGTPVHGASRPSTDDAATELAQHVQYTESRRTRDGHGRWDLKARLEEFAANQAEKIRDRIRAAPNTESLPVRVIPAPPRRGAALQQVLEEEEMMNSPQILSRDAENGSENPWQGGPGPTTGLDPGRSSASQQQQGEPPLPPNNPPLWRGVQSQTMYEDEYYDDGESFTDTSSSVGARQQGSLDTWRRSRSS